MILNSEEIKNLKIIESFDEKKFRNASYDLSIDKIITMDGKERASGYKIKSQEMIWVICKEKFNMPMDVIGFAHMYTHRTREGILSMNTGIIDPGYEGKISTLLINFGKGEQSILKNSVLLRVTFADINNKNNELKPSRIIMDDDTYWGIIQESTKNFDKTFLNMETVYTKLYGFLLKSVVRVIVILAAIASIIGLLLLILELIKKIPH